MVELIIYLLNIKHLEEYFYNFIHTYLLLFHLYLLLKMVIHLTLIKNEEALNTFGSIYK